MCMGLRVKAALIYQHAAADRDAEIARRLSTMAEQASQPMPNGTDSPPGRDQREVRRRSGGARPSEGRLAFAELAAGTATGRSSPEPHHNQGPDRGRPDRRAENVNQPNLGAPGCGRRTYRYDARTNSRSLSARHATSTWLGVKRVDFRVLQLRTCSCAFSASSLAASS